MKIPPSFMHDKYAHVLLVLYGFHSSVNIHTFEIIDFLQRDQAFQV